MIDLQPLLRTKNLAIGYEANQAILESLDLSLFKGELVCLLGENGIGKSTLLKTLSKTIPLLSGDVFVGKESISTLSQHALAKKMSLVLTGSLQTGMMGVMELVALGRYPHTGWGGKLTQHDLEIVNRTMSLTDIQNISNKKATELSDGQLQKVMIARAVAQDSDLMILDEPTAFLDVNNRVEIMYMLKKLATETNKSILISTHDLDLAFQISDKLWLATKEGITTGCPEDLILNGEIERTFSTDNFHFEIATGKFRKTIQHTKTITLTGEGTALLWTKNALERIGYSISTEKQDLKLEVIKSTENYGWRLKVKEEGHTFSAVADLLAFLKKRS